ncbi:MAG TPA: lactate utilization protein C [Thermoleophilaceae bacterium]|nr:lactate utilization protein C [Thermoleophilaceae bacterium]
MAESVTSDARSVVLGRIREALADKPPPVPVEAPHRRPQPGGAAAAALFAERVADYRATVSRCVPDALRETVAAACRRHGARTLAAPAALPPAWVPAGCEVRVDEPALAIEQLDAVDGAITGASLAIAETGTIVLDGDGVSGRRALSLIPDLHICVVDEAQIVATVDDAFVALADSARDGRPLTFVSGPSATSDIELRRVEGVHGPRRLEVIVVA